MTQTGQFHRGSYLGTTALSYAQEAARYQVIVFQETQATFARALKADNPNLLCGLYQEPTTCDVNGDPNGITHLLPGSSFSTSLTLKDQNNNPIKSTGYTTSHNEYLIDPENASFQSIAISHVQDLLSTNTWADFVFIDDLIPNGPAFMPSGITCPKYSTFTAWQTGQQALLAAFAPAIQAGVNPITRKSYLVFGNISWANTNDAQVWKNYSTNLDGAEEESFTDGGLGINQQLNPFNYTLAKMNNATWAESQGMYVLCHSYNNTHAGNVFGLATMLLVANGLMSYSTSNTNYTGQENWFDPQYTDATQLGNPTAAYRTIGGTAYGKGLSVRDFDNGYVVVNPTSSTLTNSTYAPNGLAPQSALIVLSPGWGGGGGGGGGGTSTLAVGSGSGQSTPTSSSFSSPLVAVLTDSSNNPVAGASVTFTAPGGGASCVFSGSGTNSITVTTDAGGNASSGSITANGITGTYAISASSTGVTNVDFTLTNTPIVVVGTVTLQNPGNLTTIISNPVSIPLSFTDTIGGTLQFNSTGLPPGIMVDNTGLISGSPTSLGVFSCSVTAADSGGPSATVNFTWTIINRTQANVVTPYEAMIGDVPTIAGYWPLDDGPGVTTARDALGVNNLVNTGGAANLGAIELLSVINPFKTGSAQFGSTYYLTPVTPSGLLAGGPLGSKTFEVWCRTGSFIAGVVASLISRAAIGLILNNNSISFTNFTATPAPLIGFLVPGQDQLAATIASIVSQVISISDSKTHHLVATFVPGGTSQVWIDANLVYSWQGAVDPSNLGSSPVVIGSNFIGYIEHAAIYTGILSPFRIKQHYRVGLGYEDKQEGLLESLFVPNASCPSNGSFDVKNGYALYYPDLLADGGILTADITYLETLRTSGYFTETPNYTG